MDLNSGRTGLPVTTARPPKYDCVCGSDTAAKCTHRPKTRFARPGIAFCSMMTRGHPNSGPDRENGDAALCPHFSFFGLQKMGTQGYVPIFPSTRLLRDVQQDAHSGEHHYERTAAVTQKRQRDPLCR